MAKKYPEWFSKLTLRKDGDITCYAVLDLKANMPHAVADTFFKWFGGQTGIILHGGEFAVYSWDLERWIEQGMRTRQGPDWD